MRRTNLKPSKQIKRLYENAFTFTVDRQQHMADHTEEGEPIIELHEYTQAHRTPNPDLQNPDLQGTSLKAFAKTLARSKAPEAILASQWLKNKGIQLTKR